MLQNAPTTCTAHLKLILTKYRGKYDSVADQEHKSSHDIIYLSCYELNFASREKVILVKSFELIKNPGPSPFLTQSKLNYELCLKY